MNNRKKRRIVPGSPGYRRWAFSQPVRFSYPHDSRDEAMEDMGRLSDQVGRGPGHVFYVSEYEPCQWAVMVRLTNRRIQEAFPDAG